MEGSTSIISEILGNSIDEDLGDPHTQSEISPDHSLNFLYSLLKEQLESNISERSWSTPQRNILKIIEDRVSLIISQENIEEEEKRLALSTRSEIYLDLLNRLEDLFEFSSMEATETDPSNWEQESLIQNVTALYELLILNRKETMVTLLGEIIVSSWSNIVEKYTQKIDKRKVKSLMKHLSNFVKEGECEEVSIVYFHLTEICEAIMGETIDAESFFEFLEQKDAGELSISLCKEIIPGDNTDFFRSFADPMSSKTSFLISIGAEVRTYISPSVSIFSKKISN